MEINDVVVKLSEAIKLSPEFSRLKQTKAIISENPMLKRELEEFNNSQKQLFNGKLSFEDAELRSKQLNTKLEGLSKIPEVKNYLNALNSLNQLMSKISKNIQESIEKSLQ